MNPENLAPSPDAPAASQAAPEVPLSPQQTKMVERLKAAILVRDSYERPTTHEYKRFELTRGTATSSVVFLKTEVGKIGDEGTTGEVYCRISRLIAITRLGGVRLLNGRISDREKKRKTYRAPRVEGFWKVVNSRTDSIGS
jgi:hypothetical protein